MTNLHVPVPHALYFRTGVRVSFIIFSEGRGTKLVLPLTGDRCVSNFHVFYFNFFRSISYDLLHSRLQRKSFLELFNSVGQSVQCSWYVLSQKSFQLAPQETSVGLQFFWNFNYWINSLLGRLVEVKSKIY